MALLRIILGIPFIFIIVVIANIIFTSKSEIPNFVYICLPTFFIFLLILGPFWPTKENQQRLKTYWTKMSEHNKSKWISIGSILLSVYFCIMAYTWSPKDLNNPEDISSLGYMISGDAGAIASLYLYATAAAIVAIIFFVKGKKPT
jgi:hypothetical protein